MPAAGCVQGSRRCLVRVRNERLGEALGRLVAAGAVHRLGDRWAVPDPVPLLPDPAPERERERRFPTSSRTREVDPLRAASRGEARPPSASSPRRTAPYRRAPLPPARPAITSRADRGTKVTRPVRAGTPLWHTTQVTRALFSLLIALAASLFGSCSPPPESTGEPCFYCCHAENQASWETCYGRGSALCPSMPVPGSAGPSAACNAICVPEACRCLAANQCAPPRCDPTSCIGCCDESQVCQAGTIDTECGSGGRNCGSCSAGESCGRNVSGECD